MSVTASDTLPLKTEQDIVMARQAVRRLTQTLAFSLVDQTKMVTAASELRATPSFTAVVVRCITKFSATEREKEYGLRSSTKVQASRISASR